MTKPLQQLFLALTLGLVLIIQAGCGEGGETNRPAVQISASTVVSQTDATGHTHTATIPFIDVSAAPASSVYQYRTSDSGGHSHVIALSQQQVIDLNNGMKVQLTSSTTNGHTHTLLLTGGNMLYDKFCYNCHSDDNRGRPPMNATLTGTQRTNLMNPAGALLSTAPAATPDPNFIPGTSPTVLDGPTLYATYCAGCHNPLASTTKPNRSATQIRNAINGVGSMGSLSILTDAQLAAIATALVR